MLAVLTSHPIQYQAPLWRAIANTTDIPFETWFLTPHGVKPSYDPQFGNTFAWDQDLTSGYPNRFLPIKKDWDLGRFRGIKLETSWSELFRRNNVTHLWVEGWRFSVLWSAIRTAARMGIAVYLRGETNDLRPRNRVRDIPRRFLLSRLFHCVDRFFCIGTANKRFYRSFGISESRLWDAPYCVDNDFFESRALAVRADREQIRSHWNIPADSFCVLFCGKFIPKKRPLDLASALHGFGKSFHQLYVGTGELEPKIRSQVHVRYDYQLQNPVISDSMTGASCTASLVGFLNQSEISKAYVAADCLVLPSDSGETWGLVVNEAIASNLSAVVSDQCGCAEDLVRPVSRERVFRCGHTADLRFSLDFARNNIVPDSILASLSAHHAPSVTARCLAQTISGHRC